MSSTVFAGEGSKFLQSKLDKIEDIRKELLADYSQENRQKAAEKIRQMALNLIDLEEIGKQSLGKHYNTVTAEQRKEFMQLFHELMADRIVQANMPDKEKLDAKLPLKITGDRQKNDRIFNKEATVVTAKVKHKRITYYIHFYFFKKNDTLKLYDVQIDDNPTTLLDYRNMFARVIEDKNKGMSHLINVLRKKINSLNPKQGQ